MTKNIYVYSFTNVGLLVKHSFSFFFYHNYLWTTCTISFSIFVKFNTSGPFNGKTKQTKMWINVERKTGKFDCCTVAIRHHCNYSTLTDSWPLICSMATANCKLQKTKEAVWDLGVKNPTAARSVDVLHLPRGNEGTRYTRVGQPGSYAEGEKRRQIEGGVVRRAQLGGSTDVGNRTLGGKLNKWGQRVMQSRGRSEQMVQRVGQRGLGSL